MIESLLSASLLLQVSLNPQHIASRIEKLPKNAGILAVDNPVFQDLPSFIAQETSVIREEGFVFEFIGCEISPNSDIPLRCEFLVENVQEEERTFGVHTNDSNYPTRVIDSSGNMIIATSVQIGSSQPGSSSKTPFPSRVPLKVVATFGEAPEGSIKLLDIGCFIFTYGSFDVEFRF